MWFYLQGAATDMVFGHADFQNSLWYTQCILSVTVLLVIRLGTANPEKDGTPPSENQACLGKSIQGLLQAWRFFFLRGTQVMAMLYIIPPAFLLPGLLPPGLTNCSPSCILKMGCHRSAPILHSGHQQPKTQTARPDTIFLALKVLPPHKCQICFSLLAHSHLIVLLWSQLVALSLFQWPPPTILVLYLLRSSYLNNCWYHQAVRISPSRLKN
jgi:hypothetical protein